MENSISVCGADCSDCTHMKDSSCLGCFHIQGRIWWAKYLNAEICPIYDCVEKKGIDHCGSCPGIPCDLWRDLKDPSYLDEENERSILERIDRLKGYEYP